VLGGRLAIMDLAAAQSLLNKEGRVDQIDIVLRKGAEVAAVQERLTAALPSVLTVQRPAQRGEQYERMLASVQAMLTGISTLCLVAGIYIVTTRPRPARAPARSWPVFKWSVPMLPLFRLLMQTFILGVVGSALGTAYGIGLACCSPAW
jgi:putative ABC transport system permease protein